MFIIFIICIPCACKLFCPSLIPACYITNIFRRQTITEVQKAARRYNKKSTPKEITFDPTEASAPMIEQNEQYANNLMIKHNSLIPSNKPNFPDHVTPTELA